MSKLETLAQSFRVLSRELDSYVSAASSQDSAQIISKLEEEIGYQKKINKLERINAEERHQIHRKIMKAFHVPEGAHIVGFMEGAAYELFESRKLIQQIRDLSNCPSGESLVGYLSELIEELNLIRAAKTLKDMRKEEELADIKSITKFMDDLEIDI